MAPKSLKKRKRAAKEAGGGEAEEAAAESPAVAGASEAAEEAAPEAAAPEVAPRKERRRGLRAASRQSKEGEAEEEEKKGEEEEAEKPTSIDLDEKEDRRGIIHLESVPAFMSVVKLRYLMEQYGEVGRIYLAPEDKVYTQRRKRSGGNKKVLFTEGWVEFAERKLARRVAESLNARPVGGKKRHNFWRDDHWSMRYLPKFKWHQLKEGVIYARQVRKARLEQRLGQARRQNNFYLEQVEQAKVKRKIAERRAKKGGSDAAESKGPAVGERTLKRRGGPKARVHEEDWEMPDRMLESLLW